MVFALTMFIAACSACMVLGSVELMNSVMDLPLVVLVFSSTVIIYTLDRLRPSIEDKTSPSERLLAYTAQRKMTLGLLVLGVIGAAVATPFQRLEVLIALVPMGFVSVWYTIPAGRLTRLKDIPYIKTFAVAGVWTFVTAWLPVWRPGVAISAPFLAHLTTRFVFMLAITLPFDLRDTERDAAAGIRTLPQRLGTRGTRAMCLGLLALFVAIHAIYDPAGMFLPNLATALVTSAILLALEPTRGDLYYSVAVDGTMMLQYALIMTYSAIQ